MALSNDVKMTAKAIESACHGFTFDDVFSVSGIETEPLNGGEFRLTIFSPRKIRTFNVTVTEACPCGEMVDL